MLRISLLLQPDLDGDGAAEIVVGFENGDILCLQSSRGEALWSYPGSDLGTGAVLRLDSFEDVDLGGSDDLLAVFADGMVRCISSGGDVAVRERNSFAQPRTPGLTMFPNPFNGMTVISFTLNHRGSTFLSAFDVTGRLVKGQDLGNLPAGSHRLAFDPTTGGALPGGLYVFKLETPDGVRTIKAVHLK